MKQIEVDTIKMLKEGIDRNKKVIEDATKQLEYYTDALIIVQKLIEEKNPCQNKNTQTARNTVL